MTLLYHNDGQDWFCDQCSQVIHRTRSNPYPDHTCQNKQAETKAKLESFGLNLQDFDQRMVTAFLKAMNKVNYGSEETLDAFQWFREGWASK